MSQKAPATEKKPLSNALKFWYGFGDFGFTLMTNVETFYFNAFMTNVAGFSAALAGTVSTITSTVDACLSWVYGGIIDAAKAGKWGRYRTWLIMVPWIIPFLFAFQFLNISANPTVSAVVICAAFILSHIGWNFPYVANVAMVSKAGGTPEGRAALASSRATWNNLSGVVFSYAFQAVAIVVADKLGADGYQYAAAAFLFGVVMAVGYFVHFKITDGYEEIEDPKAPRIKQKQTTPKDMAKALLENQPLLLLVLADLAKWIVKFLVAASAVYYFKYAMGTGLQITYVFFANLAAVLGAFLARYIAKKMSNRGCILFAYLAMAILMIAAYFLYAMPTVVFILMLLAQCGYGVCYACSPALYADTAVYAKWKSGKDSTGFIMGLQNVPLKVAVMIKSVILNACLALAGYDAFKTLINEGVAALDFSYVAQLPASLQRGICASFCLWPAVFLLIGFFLLKFGYKLTNERIEQYQAEIDARA
ncbi:MAG: MFS transporter [Eubacteriales bacterium]|nr:MFS transporter [Eubacteriales bacterium]